MATQPVLVNNPNSQTASCMMQQINAWDNFNESRFNNQSDQQSSKCFGWADQLRLVGLSAFEHWSPSQTILNKGIYTKFHVLGQCAPELLDKTGSVLTGCFAIKALCAHLGLHASFGSKKAECFILLTRLRQQEFKNKPFKLMYEAQSHQSAVQECAFQLGDLRGGGGERKEKNLGIYPHREWISKPQRWNF